jgi:hypothetical protein
MNKIKAALVLVFVCAVSVPSFGSEAAIKRKKNKWVSAVEQVSDIKPNPALEFVA